MKKFACVLLGILLSLGVFAFAACGENYDVAETPAEAAAPAETKPALPSEPAKEPELTPAPAVPETKEEPAAPAEPVTPPAPAVSPLAALDKIEIARAFGDTAAEDWSFALRAAGSANYFHDFKWTSEITDREKFYLGLSAGLNIDDTFGIRSAQNGVGIDLFGGGKVGLDLGYITPKSYSEPHTKTLDAGFKHDGDLIFYTDNDGNEKSITISELTDNIDAELAGKAMEKIAGAVTSIPEDLKKGLSLRLAVENLIDLGFTVQIDDSQGLTVRLVANHGFFTGLLNDLLEELLPEELLNYLPRADFGYSSTDFEITLAFDENGLFKKYAFSSDTTLSFSLEVRHLFLCESNLKLGSGMSVEAFYGDVPGFGEAA